MSLSTEVEHWQQTLTAGETVLRRFLKQQYGHINILNQNSVLSSSKNKFLECVLVETFPFRYRHANLRFVNFINQKYNLSFILIF